MRRFLSYMLFVSLFVPLVNLFPITTASAQDAAQLGTVDIKTGIQRLKSDTGGAALVSTNRATGAARFVRMSSGKMGSDFSALSGGKTAAEKSTNFFRTYGSAFGIRNPATELKLARKIKDVEVGGEHLVYDQVYNGVKVFAGELRTHFDREGNLRSINGIFVPNIALKTVPSRSAGELAERAIAIVAGMDRGDAPAVSNANLAVKNATLYIFREGLIQGIPGENHLAWEMEVTNGGDVREYVYIDAHSGKMIDQITGIQDGMNRRAFDGQGSPNSTPPNYPNTPFWIEGQAFPTGNTEADNMIRSSEEVYNLFHSGFNRDSFNGTGGTMDAIFNRGNACPNASWNGTFISFCPGFTTDDVTAHEWGHAYTQYTHGLIYQWQSGALNESYSDIWGETVDRLNNLDGTGNSATDPLRTGACSTSTAPTGKLIANSPAAIAGNYFAQNAGFGASTNPAGYSITGDVVVGLDASNASGPLTTDGCTAFTNAAAVNGKIALVDRGTCNFSEKVFQAQNAGAIGVIVNNNAANGIPGMGAGTNAANVTIYSVGVQKATGDAIKAQLALPATVNVTLQGIPGTDASTRWLMGEDVTPGGSLRDMYNPNCYSNPGKVSDTQYYVCGPGTSANDNGGVHTNSGVPNKAFALLVDGGTYNSQTINPIGLTKAAHIYFRAQNVYQNKGTNFPEHADALETAANDLIGETLNSLSISSPTSGDSGETITAADVAEVHKATLATELRNAPTQCAFGPSLGQTPPADTCGTGTSQAVIFADNFEDDNSAWTATGVAGATNSGGFNSLPNWAESSTLPDGRAGKGFFAPNVHDATTCSSPTTGQAGIRFLTSPLINIPSTATGARILRFDHWFAIEPGFDAGQLYYSVNGGPFVVIPRTATSAGNFLYNPTNGFIATTNQGNDNPRAQTTPPANTAIGWWGTRDGSVDEGSWGTTVVDLTSLAAPGSNIQLRWDLSNDSCGGRAGWYIDNVKLATCISNTDLSIIKKASSPSTLIGSEITYTYTVKNSGPTNATSVLITDPLPAGLSFVSSPDGCTEATPGVVTCNIGNLANGATVVRHMVAKTTKIGRINNTASLTQFEPDTVVPGNNSGAASVNVLAALRSLTFTPTAVIGGCANSTGKVLLNAAAPAGGLIVELTSADPAVSVPSTISFNAGETQKTFAATSSTVSTIKTVNVTAKVQGTVSSVLGRLQVKPVPIVNMTFAPNPVAGGNAVVGTVTLSCAAPYDIVVKFTSNKTVATPQSQITILAGQTSGQVNLTTKKPLSQTVVNITAKGNGSTLVKTLTVTP